MTPIKINRVDMLAYERRTGFVGIGDFLERRGRVIITDRGIQCLETVAE